MPSEDLEFEFLTVGQRGDVAVVGLNRPPVNAVNDVMYGEIRELFGRTDEYLPDIGAVILRGEGRMFSAGNDLNTFASMTPRNALGRMRLVRDAFAAIYDCPVPVIAAVHGHALGTGVALAASCDVVVCAEGAMLGTPEVSVGVMGGARHLARLVPQQVMRLMYFTAEPVPASELVRYGGIAAIVAEDELLDAALGLAARMTSHSKSALRMAKKSLNTVEFMDLKAGYESEQWFTGLLAADPESMASRRAALDGRATASTPSPPAGGVPPERRG